MERIGNQPDDDTVFGARNGTSVINWFHKLKSKSNQFCLYCGENVGDGSNRESNKEHLIGRDFVPSGTFEDGKSFNFIFRACIECNSEKAKIENHLSAISLLDSPGREIPNANEIAIRKGSKSYDPRLKQPVGEISNEIKVGFGGFMTFGLVSGAQADMRDTKALSLRHVQGLFSLITSHDPRSIEGTRLLSEEYFGFFSMWKHADWGNPQLLEISRRVSSWECITLISTANGFFRAAFRRLQEGQPWFWALEWNKNFRLIGWIGDPDDPPGIFQNLPTLPWRQIDAQSRLRKEVPLEETAADILFTCEELK